MMSYHYYDRHYNLYNLSAQIAKYITLDNYKKKYIRYLISIYLFKIFQNDCYFSSRFHFRFYLLPLQRSIVARLLKSK